MFGRSLRLGISCPGTAGMFSDDSNEVLRGVKNLVHDSTVLPERVVEQLFFQLRGYVRTVQVPQERPRVHLHNDILSR